ncbi:hypothetical protein D9758_010355 [Tetrapyrgos nigripes]|uniref:ABM domain-containing protein n=1 Tax=Tetrapyrgos nigripes TaxID=182062 RepID=A0A8H5D283_9AGAR|nr:hypothetical protein D9758_010355 [Tetrapyrgos nigripes]
MSVTDTADTAVDNLPERTSSGKLMVICYITIKPGQEEKFEKMSLDTRLYANSDKEPGTLTYRTTRVVGTDGKPVVPAKYVFIEEYSGKSSLLTHTQSPPQLEYIKGMEDVMESLTVDIVDEF